MGHIVILTIRGAWWLLSAYAVSFLTTRICILGIKGVWTKVQTPMTLTDKWCHWVALVIMSLVAAYTMGTTFSAIFNYK